MAMEPKANSTRKPPDPSDDHGEIEGWMRRVMPDLHPIVVYLDQQIRDSIPGLQFALKWKKAYYGLPNRGWVIELVAYDVSVNVVFLGGADFDTPPPQGSGRSRYVKIRTIEEAKAPEVTRWIGEAARHPGWQ